jgi:hypothetical protein
MSTLYSLHLSRHVPGMVKGPVKSHSLGLFDGLIGDLDDSGNLVTPDASSVRECLPHYYRKAFDRANKSQIRGECGVFWTLRSAKGKYLNTVYALPYTHESRN